MGNKAIEDAAITWVMEIERAAGRDPQDTRHSRSAADIESSGRVIEVKAAGTSSRGYDLWLEPRQVAEAQRNPDFYVYLVENVRQGDPAFFTVKVFGGDRLRRLVARARERHYFEVPVPVAEYDAAPTALDREALEPDGRQ